MDSVLLERITKGTEPRPGSIHELESVIERAFVASPVTAFSLPERLRSFPRLPPSVRAARREEPDRGRIVAVLEACRWKIRGFGTTKSDAPDSASS
jgi:transcriptional regulator of acetoin/glycerol metabolism